MRYQILRAFSVAKHEETTNEDRWCGSIDGTAFAVSDGASISFDPAPWASLLTETFVRNQNISPTWIAEAARGYAKAYDRETMPWMYQAAFDRGSFATLLGIVFSEDGCSARAFAFGDSLLVCIVDDVIVRTLPYETAGDFDKSPKLLPTSHEEARSISEEAIFNAWYDIDIPSQPSSIFLLLTDAVGRWLLDEVGGSRIAALLSATTPAEFAVLVTSERAHGRLKRDDTTMIVLGPVRQ